MTTDIFLIVQIEIDQLSNIHPSGLQRRDNDIIDYILNTLATEYTQQQVLIS